MNRTKWYTIFFIAHRYFYAHKSTNAVNIIAGISVACIAVVSMAMVVLFSVFNGFERFSKNQFEILSPDLLVETRNQDVFHLSTDSIQTIQEQLGTEDLCKSLSGQAMLHYQDNYVLAILHGVDNKYQKVVTIDSVIFEGQFQLHQEDEPAMVLGAGLAAKLGAGIGYLDPIELIIPKRLGHFSTIRPDRSFIQRSFVMKGSFRTDQETDETTAFLPLSTMQALLQYDSDSINSLLIRLPKTTNIEQAKKKLQKYLGQAYVVKDRVEQHPEVFKVIKIEKWISYFILLFVLLLSVFSIVSTLGMLIIEKRSDTATLHALGAEQRMSRRIIIVEGLMLSLIGALIGLLVGVLLVLLQSHFELVKLATSNTGVFFISAYPVELHIGDLLTTLLTIILVGYASSYIAYHIFADKEHKKKLREK